MANINFSVDHFSNVMKFQQLVDAIIDSISRDELKVGEMLPSVNQLMKDCHLSRDTVFKAYADLKQRGVVESVPNRGYFVAKNITKAFLLLDTFKAYKEVLYMAFRESVNKNVTVDLNFHHYNIKVFESVIRQSLGKYSRYIVMNFDHPQVAEIINLIPKEQLLVIDWRIHAGENHSYVAQDFGQPVYDCFNQNLARIKKYNEFIFYYPAFTYHPVDAIEYFEKFCGEKRLRHRVISEPKEFDIKKGDLYFLVSDRTLALFLDQCEDKNLVPGVDVGVISYNETPMKKYVKNGITVISTNFEMMGQKAAEFVNTGNPVQLTVPTSLKLRSSL